MKRRERGDDGAAPGGGAARGWDPASLLLVGIPQAPMLLTCDAALQASPARATQLLAQVARDEAAALAVAAAARDDFLQRRLLAEQANMARLHALPGELGAAALEDALGALRAARAAGKELDVAARLADWGVPLSAEVLAAAAGAGGEGEPGGGAPPPQPPPPAASGGGMDVDEGGGGEPPQAPPAASPPPPLLQELLGGGASGERAYHGRPARGATSGALFLSAEWETGAPPPPAREGWRYLVGAGADGLPQPQAGGGGGGGGGGSRVMDAALVAQAREALKRPAFPDRRIPMPATGAGSADVRGLALAADFDEAAAVEARAREVRAAALAQLGARG